MPERYLGFTMQDTMPRAFIDKRQMILDEYDTEKRREGINVKRVLEFLRNNRININPKIIFLKPEEAGEFDSKVDIDREPLENGGSFYPHVNLVVVLRNKEMERYNGLEYTEGILVHELVHYATKFKRFKQTRREGGGSVVDVPRLGLSTSTQTKIEWGHFLEEGLCDMFRGRYIEKNITPIFLESIEHGTGYKKCDCNDTVPAGRVGLEMKVPLPVKYLYNNENDVTTGSKAAFAGFGVELLVKKFPELLPLLQEARQTKEGLKVLGHFFTKITPPNQPNLYFTLQRGAYNDLDFMKKLQLIIKNFYGDGRGIIQSHSEELSADWEKLKIN